MPVADDHAMGQVEDASVLLLATPPETEDRYPDIFGLRATDPTTRNHARDIVREQLTHLPHHILTLGHEATRTQHEKALAEVVAEC